MSAYYHGNTTRRARLTKCDVPAAHKHVRGSQVCELAHVKEWVHDQGILIYSPHGAYLLRDLVCIGGDNRYANKPSKDEVAEGTVPSEKFSENAHRTRCVCRRVFEATLRTASRGRAQHTSGNNVSPGPCLHGGGGRGASASARSLPADQAMYMLTRACGHVTRTCWA